MHKNYLSIILFSFLVFQESNAQPELMDSLYTDSNPILPKKVIAVTGISAIYLATLYDSYITWWEDSQRPFTLHSGEWFDPLGDNGIDKLGHFFTSYAFYKVQRNIFLWGGFHPLDARIYSGSLTLLMALLIEAGDGFSRYGFDYKDFIFNMSGLTYGILQDEVPFLNYINIKWSYFPKTGISFPPKFSDHYEGHTYWLTINALGIVNSFSEDNLPEYIQPAIGYSISPELKSELMVGLDFNLMPLFSKENSLSVYLGDFINLFHIPAPGVKFTEDENPEYKLFLLR